MRKGRGSLWVHVAAELTKLPVLGSDGVEEGGDWELGP